MLTLIDAIDTPNHFSDGRLAQVNMRARHGWLCSYSRPTSSPRARPMGAGRWSLVAGRWSLNTNLLPSTGYKQLTLTSATRDASGDETATIDPHLLTGC